MITFRSGRCYVLMAICFLVLNTRAEAQQYYHLKDLVAAAKTYLPVLKQKEAVLNASKAAVTDTKHSMLPQLRFSEQLNIASDNSLAGSFFTYGITPSTSAGVRAENTLQAATGNVAVLYGEYELFNFGLNDAKLKYAKSFVQLQQSDLEKEQYILQLETARLYFNILKYQQRLNADRQNIERYQNIFTVIHALTASGLKAGADSSMAKAELSKTRISYNQTEGRIAQLKEQLSFLTGIPPAGLLIDTAGIRAMREQSLPDDMQIDTLNNPLLNYYASRQQVFSANEDLIRKSYRPKIMLSGATWARGSSIQFPDQFKSLETGLGYQRFNYALGVAFTYNLFNGIYRKDKLAINRYQSEAAGFELQQQKAVLQSASRQAENVLHTTKANLDELPIQLRSATDTYQQKLAQYKAGIISLIDLTNASFVLYRSQTDYIETLSDWYLGQLDRSAAAGTLSSFIQTIN